ncbi:hypothetical protein BC940DRAFT_330796 [Gongronella butleri]|nr:hypothetical protein BC940DRAFT_330796 [Gongronella butleri]
MGAQRRSTSIACRYPDVWPMTLETSNGPKLTIGTQSLNGLVTSSIRLDCKMPPSVGATTRSFMLKKDVDSQATRIFVDQESLDRAMLRQLNSKYDSISTFFLARASGPITKAHVCQPYTVFTLFDFDSGRNTSAALFSCIGSSVIVDGKQAQLALEDVQEFRQATTGKAYTIMTDIVKLFGKRDKHIAIIKNAALNKLLEKLVPFLHSGITTANKSVEIAIAVIFTGGN